MTHSITSTFLLMAAMVVSLFAGSAQAANLTTCEAFLKRACSSQEKIGFEQGLKSVRSKQSLVASNCDSFLGRECSSNEKHYYEQGSKSHVVKDQLACNCDSFLHRACSRSEALSYSKSMVGRTNLASNCKYSGSTLALNQ